MIQLVNTNLPGQVLAGLLLIMLGVIAVRLSDETSRATRNHVIIIGGAAMAFGIVYRILDVVQHLDVPRWSAVVGAIGVLAFLAAEPQIAARYRRFWLRIFPRKYDGPERRRGPRLGTDPDEDFPRDERP